MSEHVFKYSVFVGFLTWLDATSLNVRILGMRNSMIESLEITCAVIVTAGLVAGNMFLFSPLRTDNRLKPSIPSADQKVAKFSDND